MSRTGLLAALAIGLAALACSASAPTAVDQPAPAAVTQDGGAVAASAGGKIPISGTLDYVTEFGPSRDFTTPGGIHHFFNYPVETVFAGSVEGFVTFTESGADLKGNKGVYHGPFEGDVTWAGHTGKMSGMWHTSCEWVPTPICGGTFEAQGSGGLEGVKFHFEWGPGIYPFNYKGFAIDNSR